MAKEVTRLKRNVRRTLRRVKVSPGKVLCVLFLLTLVVVETPAKHFVLALTGRFQDAYVTYRLASERDALLAANQRLSEEVQSLRSEAFAGEFETKVLTQLEELQGIIESATELDLERGAAPASARKSVSGRDALAAILENPTIKNPNGRPSKPAKRKGTRRGSEGNAEKENISFSPGLFSFRPGIFNPSESAPEVEWTRTRRALVRKADRLAHSLRAMPLGYPVEGEITSGFGYRRSPTAHGRHMHEGLDISLDRGGDVLVTGDGEVFNVEYDGAYGWFVDVQHAPGLTTRYAHLSKPLVKKGQRVGRGDRIALSGNTGRSTGPHLHYEVRVNGNPRDPQPYVLLPQKLSSAF